MSSLEVSAQRSEGMAMMGVLLEKAGRKIGRYETTFWASCGGHPTVRWAYCGTW